MSWFDIPQWIRLVWALAVTVGATVLLVWVDLELGIIALGVATIFLIISGRDNSDRRGYKF